MAEATRERVRTAIDELGFIRNESARRLRVSPDHAARGDRPAPRSQALGFVLEDLANPYFTDVAKGAERALADSGINVLWATSDGLPGKEQRVLDFLADQGVAGLLITPIGLTPERIASLREQGTAVVVMDREMAGVCSARVDHVAGGDIAVTHLIRRHGPRRLAFVTASPGVPGFGPIRDRLIGAATALERADLEKPAVLAEPAMTPRYGQVAARRLLRLDPLPTAVFCANDLLAVGLVNELLRVGVKVPEEIAVVGYDDIELAATSVVPLTTVRQPRHELGRLAAGLLLAEMAEPRGSAGHRHTQTVLTPSLVVRESG